MKQPDLPSLSPDISPEMQSKRILLIEDDDRARESMKAVLSAAGYGVTSTNSGTRGVFEYAVFRPDLVITDVLMDGQEGIETLLQLQRHDPAVRVIVISGGGYWHSSDYCLKIALNLGARATLAKPFSKDQLLSTVALVLNGAPPTPPQQ